MGPMRAAREFALRLERKGLFSNIVKMKVELYGSLAMTGEGHGTGKAILLGLEGFTPEGIDPDKIEEYLTRMTNQGIIHILGKHLLSFSQKEHLKFCKGKSLPYHPNAMKYMAYDEVNQEIDSEIYYSIGGGFYLSHTEVLEDKKKEEASTVPCPYETAEELLKHCSDTGKKIYEIQLENEKTSRCEADVYRDLLHIWHIMQQSVRRGCMTQGILPGGLNVKRRAPGIYMDLMRKNQSAKEDPTIIMDWISLFAIAVNEENAAGSRIVTSPTNGAAGIIPAVLHYYQNYIDTFSAEGIVEFLLTAGAICAVFKKKASISGAEMGCQGEVGVACSIAAAGLAAVLGGTNEQIENAAEIGMEHNLGLTCDPIGGLVQIPCIERNTMGAVQAINAARLSMLGGGTHSVSLDEVIQTMHRTGLDMKTKYKETSEGGLAEFVDTKDIRERQLFAHIPVNIPEC